MAEEITLETIMRALERSVSNSNEERKWAEQLLEHVARINLPQYLAVLSHILSTVANSELMRTAAGLQMKNLLSSKDERVKEQYQQRWQQFDIAIRESIKVNILNAVCLETTRPSCAAQCVACVAITELAAGRWDQLIPTLCNKVLNERSTRMERGAAIETIGYICQDIHYDVPAEQYNSMLTAIAYGMRGEQSGKAVYLTAIKAMHNALEFSKRSFEVEPERNFIMEMICQSTQSTDARICVAALECLVKIMEIYYGFMKPYMTRALFSISLYAMQSETEAIALQGIEFWSNICDKEIELDNAASAAAAINVVVEQPTVECGHYARKAVPFLAPVLLELLMHQEERQDEQSWIPAKSASVCLTLLAKCCEDDILTYVSPFIRDNIDSIDWRSREAAVMSLGCVLDGLKISTLHKLVDESFLVLLRLVNDDTMAVRDTTIWAIGRICNIIPETVLGEAYLMGTMRCIVNCLKLEHHVALYALWALLGLSEAAFKAAVLCCEEARPRTYRLSPYFDELVSEILRATERREIGCRTNLSATAFEVLMKLIQQSPLDCYVVMQNTTIVIMDRIHQLLEAEHQISSQTFRDDFVNLKSLLGATLQTVLFKLTNEDVLLIADAVMQCIIALLSRTDEAEAYCVVSVLLEKIDSEFNRYLDKIVPFLITALRKTEELHLFNCAIGLFTDICRSLQYAIAPYCDQIVALLIDILSDPALNVGLKAQILSTFGDVAVCTCVGFVKHLDAVMNKLHSVGQETAANADIMLDHKIELYDAILEAYTGIIQGVAGMSAQPKPEIVNLEPYLQNIVDFLKLIASDNDVPERLEYSAVGMIGDMCTLFNNKMSLLLANSPLPQFVMFVTQRPKSDEKRRLCGWAGQRIFQLYTSHMISQ